MSVDSGLPVIMITSRRRTSGGGSGWVGAYDFLEKPFNPDPQPNFARRDPGAAP